jgi:hypothetical protein
MGRDKDAGTLDLFRDTQPAPVVERFAEERVRAASHAARVARAVSEALRDCDFDREAVAKEMSAYLGERVSKAMLEAYASQARETHTIPAHRLIALAVVTGSAKLINALLEGTGLIAVEGKYEALIERERLKEHLDDVQRKIAARDAQWKASRR